MKADGSAEIGGVIKGIRLLNAGSSPQEVTLEEFKLNLANKGWKVVVWNRTVPGKEENVVEHFIANRAKGKGIIGSNELTDFVEALKTPRVILLMVQAGPAVDELTGKLFPLMERVISSLTEATLIMKIRNVV